MRLLIAVFLCTAFALAQDVVVFRGTPHVRVYATAENETREKLDGEAADKSECVIVQRGKKYFWASRNNSPVNRIDGSQFTYFVHTEGAGYVKIFTGERKPGATVEYLESITQGLDLITYWGRVNN
jgi:hypothetical protein